MLNNGLKTADRDVKLTTMNNSTAGTERHCLLATLIICGRTSWLNCGRRTFRNLSFLSCIFVFLVLDKMFHQINIYKPWSHDSGQAGNVVNTHLNYFAWPPRKAGKTDTISLICEKICMTNEIASHQRGTTFIRWICTE